MAFTEKLSHPASLDEIAPDLVQGIIIGISFALRDSFFISSLIHKISQVEDESTRFQHILDSYLGYLFIEKRNKKFLISLGGLDINIMPWFSQ